MAKKTARKTELKPTEMRVPKHGNGALRVGNPGCAGGTGRPPNRIRAMVLADLEATVPVLKQIAEDAGAKDNDRINAIATQARIALPAQVEAGENPDAPFLTPEQRLAAVKAKLGL